MPIERIIGILKFMKVLYPHQVDMDTTVQSIGVHNKLECRVNG